MISADPKSNVAVNEWRAGWGIVLASTVGIGIATSYFHLFGVLMQPLGEAYGWSRGQLAFGLTLITAIHLVANLLVGQLVDRIGPRPVALWGSAFFGLAMLSLGFAGPALWTWYVACAAFSVLTASTGVPVWTAGIVRRFVRQRGLALAISLAGTGVMVAIIPSLVLALLQSVGVRGVFFVIGGVGSAIMLVLTWLFFHDISATSPANTFDNSETVPVTLSGLTVKEALSSFQFWQLAIAVLLMSLCISAFLVHLQPILNDSGMTPATAATVAFFVGPSVIVGRLITGALLDRFETRLVATLAFGLPMVGCLVLLNLAGGTYAVAALAGVVVGLSIGAESDVLAYVTSRYFGLRRYGVLFSIFLSIYACGVGSGASLLGFVYDLSHSYRPVLLGLSGSALVATLLVASIGRPRMYEEPKQIVVKQTEPATG